MGVMREAASRRVGRYEVLEYLGSGGMSDVYAAMHTGLRKRVALKVLRSTLRDDLDAVERFLREGECASRVSHPNVVNVHDVGVDEGVPYLVMELLTGESLDQRISREGALPRELAIDLMLPIFDALDHVHRAGVVHRDVKPSNILLARRADGSILPKLVDFGVATLNERRLITGSLGPIGTPTYMSPEQARGLDPVDAQSDQYSLASMLFEVLTGREPFPGADVDSVLALVSRGQFPHLRDELRGAPRALDEALARATAFHPRDRFPSVREFAEALLPFASRRMRDAWRENDGMATEDSGARFSMTVPKKRDSQATMRISRTSMVSRVQAPKLQSKQQRRLVIGSVAALAMALGLAVGVAHSRGQSADLTVPVAGPISTPLAAKAPESAPQKPLALSRAGVRFQVSPAYAETALDGVVLGKGAVELPAVHDDALHELRISAKGYVTRIVLFRGKPTDLSVALPREQ